MNTTGIEFLIVGFLSSILSLIAFICLARFLIEFLKPENAALIPVRIEAKVIKTPNSEAGFSIIEEQLKTICSFPIVQERRYEAPMP